MKILHLLPTAMLLFAVPVMAQQTKKAVTAVKKTNLTLVAQNDLLPVDKALKMGKLPNGLSYYIRKNTEPGKRAVLYLVTKTGSIMEDPDQLGLAHFTEHMAFNGTRDFPKQELIDYLQKAGVKFGADVNASTSFNETIYKLPLPTDSLEVFKKSFSILANWAGMVTFDEEAINRERGIILEEERSRGKNVTERIQKQVFPILLNNSRYAQRMPIGKDEILKNFKPATIKRFYKDWYRPNLQAVIAVGDFDPVQVEELIRKNFSTLKNPQKIRERIPYTIPSNKNIQVKIVTDKEQTSTRLQIIRRIQGKATKTTGDLVQSLTRSIFNRMIGARAAELRQEPNSPLLIGSIVYGSFLADIDAFTIALTAKPGRLEQATKVLLSLNEQVKQFGFTETELERAKKSLFNTIEKQWKEKNKTNSIKYVNEYLSHFLKGEAIPGIDFEYRFIKNNLDHIKLDQLNKLAIDLNQPENKVIIVEAPEKDKAMLPDEKKLLSWMHTVGIAVKPYKDDMVTVPLLDRIPDGPRATAVKTNPSTGVTELILGNDVKVVLKPTLFKNDQIIINGYSYGGTSVAPDSIYPSAALATLLINRSGLGNLSKAQLNKMLGGRSVNISASINEFTEGISGTSSPKELETAMQLIYLYFTEPRKDQTAWSSTLSQQQANTANRGANPTQVFQDTVIAVLNNYNPRKINGKLTSSSAPSIDLAYQFYKDRFADASDFTFILVGAMDIALTIPLIERYLGALPAINRIESYKDPGFNVPAGHLTKMVYKGIEAKSRVQLVFNGHYNYNKQNNIQLEALKEMINYRMLSRLRAKESGVYTPSVSLAYTRIPNEKYSITITFNCAPEKATHLIEACLEEIRMLKKEGPSSSDLQKFIAAQQRMREPQMESNTWWAYYLRSQYMTQAKPDEKAPDNSDLTGVTMESIKAAANSYIDEDRLIEFVLMPERK